MVEKAHPIDVLDILIDQRWIERLSGVRIDVNFDRVGLDALISLDPNFRNYWGGRLRLRRRDPIQQCRHDPE
jgi:hypothetical protein